MRPALLLTAGLLIVVAALVAAVYFWSPRANLRVTTGPLGSTAYLITAFASVTEANHPRIHIKLVQVADLAASAKAIEDHATDLGIVRSDAVIPTNGDTIAILRRDVVAFVVPAKFPIDKIPALAGKTIGIPQEKKYQTKHPIELLCYTAARLVTTDNEIIQKAQDIIELRGLGMFRRMWLLGERGVWLLGKEGCQIISERSISE